MQRALIFSFMCAFGSGWCFGLVVGQRNSACEKRLDDTLDFIGLVVDDVERDLNRTAAVLTSSGQMIESMNRQAKEAPVPRSFNYVSGKPWGVNDFVTACVADKCYVQIDGVWKLLEAEP